jgi:hypothetical protein
MVVPEGEREVRSELGMVNYAASVMNLPEQVAQTVKLTQSQARQVDGSPLSSAKPSASSTSRLSNSTSSNLVLTSDPAVPVDALGVELAVSW